MSERLANRSTSNFLRVICLIGVAATAVLTATPKQMEEFASAVDANDKEAEALPHSPPLTPHSVEGKDRIEVEASSPLSYDGEKKRLHTKQPGEVSIKFRELSLKARALEYDSQSQTIDLRDKVAGSFRGAEFSGQWFRYDLRARRWVFGEGHSTLLPEFFGQGVVEPVYLTTDEVEGTQQEARVRKGLFTTCSKRHAHYSFRAPEARIIPGDKMVVRKVGFYVGDRRLFGIPTFTVSLKERRRRMTTVPEVGQNDIEGFFVKTSYAYLTTRNTSGVVRLDWLQKRGTGLGIEQDYAFKAGTGALFFYWLRDRRRGTELEQRFQHEHKIGASTRLRFSFDSRQNSAYFAQKFTSTVGDFSLQRTVGTDTTTLSFRQQSYSGVGRTKDQLGTLTHSFRKGALSGQLQTNLRRFERGVAGEATDEELNTRFELRRAGEVVDFLLRWEQRTDLDKEKFTGDRFFFALDRKPEIVLQSGSRRLPPRLLRSLPFTWSLGWGEFREQPEGKTLSRITLRTDLQTKTVRLSGPLSLNWGGYFEQFFYGDNTAQYIYANRSDLTWRLGKRSNMGLSYFLQSPHGFTPLRFDALSKYESLDYRLLVEPSERFQLNLTTGMDVERSIFRDIILSTQWRARGGMSLALSSGYDIERGGLRDVLFRLGMASPTSLLKTEYAGAYIPTYPSYPTPYPWEEQLGPPPGGYRLNLTTRFIPDMGKLARVRAFADWRVSKKWRIEALIGYNGFTERFDFTQLRLTRDLHCWQAGLTYDKERREIRFDLNIKAFPLLRQFFGRSTTSQLLDTSVGEIY